MSFIFRKGAAFSLRSGPNLKAGMTQLCRTYFRYQIAPESLIQSLLVTQILIIFAHNIIAFTFFLGRSSGPWHIHIDWLIIVVIRFSALKLGASRLLYLTERKFPNLDSS
jgi:hypothetical protein